MEYPTLLSYKSLLKVLPAIALGTMAASSYGAAGEPNEHPGAVIYKKLCLDCHGQKGEGVAGKYDDPLHGDRSLESLAKRIDRTMPEEDPDVLDAEGSAQVAAYIYDAFYSPAAQAKHNPARKDLARLTVAQYQTSVADLVGRFRPGFDRAPGVERGLKARYSGFALPQVDPAFVGPPAPTKEEKKDRARHRFERVDPQVSFQFGPDSPDKATLASDEFSARWEGGVIAQETGTYEFVVKTQNGFRLYVNDTTTPIIDGWVSSGPDVREEKKSIFLLGGRSYAFTLEFFKYREDAASVQLMWKTPHGVLEPVPTRNLSPNTGGLHMVVNTTFPADDRSDGYERGTGASKTWDQATTDAAIEVAEHVDKNLDRLAGTKSNAPDRVEKLKEFSRKFAETAFRRPLTEEQKQRFVEAQFAKAASPEVAVKRVVLFSLKSPRFLYPDLQDADQPDDYTVASRLALALWDSIPDGGLTRMAAEGKLKQRNQIAEVARRMILDPRAKIKLHGFFHHWLELDRASTIAKDAKTFPGFDEHVLADLRESLWMFVDQVVWSEKSDYRELLQADYLWLNDTLGKFYGKTDAPHGEFQKVSLTNEQRTGVVTHPYLLAAFAYHKDTSPIHRGVFLTRNIVGMSLKSPPMAVEFEDSHFDPTLTMREKITAMTKDNACMGCHSVINPLGFSLENYDAIGRWRTKEKNKPVDPAGHFANEQGQTIQLNGARDIATYAASSESGHRAFVRHLFHHTVKQPVAAFGEDALEKLRKNFTDGGCNIQKLLGEIALMSATEGLPAPVPNPPKAATPPAPKPTPAPAPAQAPPVAVVTPAPAPGPAPVPAPAAGATPAPISTPPPAQP
ncbi:MAG: DUF1592 domain-containing protein [Verrucomicrobium sp.]